MSGRSSKQKGHAYENYIARLFRRIGFPYAKRHLEYQSDEAIASMDLEGTEPFAVQCKCWKSAPPITVVETIEPDDEYPIPVAILKRTRSKDNRTLEVTVIPLKWFMAAVYILNYYDELGLWKQISRIVLNEDAILSAIMEVHDGLVKSDC